MWASDFLEKFYDWLDFPDANDVDDDYEPPPMDEVGLKPGAPTSAIEAYEEFKISFRASKERLEKVISVQNKS